MRLVLIVLLALGIRAEAQTISVAITGEPQVVFRWQTDRCAPDDFADSPARAFRSADGQVRLIASHMEARVMAGPDLDHLRHDCRVAFAGRRDDDPGAYDDRAWILSPYTLDGRTVVALIHDEFPATCGPRCARRATIIAAGSTRLPSPCRATAAPASRRRRVPGTL